MRIKVQAVTWAVLAVVVLAMLSYGFTVRVVIVVIIAWAGGVVSRDLHLSYLTARRLGHGAPPAPASATTIQVRPSTRNPSEPFKLPPR